jgi:hypothetical protein
MVIFAIGVK